MQLMDPTVPNARPNNRRADALQSLEGLTIGLLSNGKLNADRLLSYTAEYLRSRYGGTVLPIARKNNASAPAPAELLTQLSPECDYLITAAGD